jgi:CelD/BcsL family acetyltransferase involved in cellulose biosynthesis
VLPPGARRDAAIAEAIAEKCGWLDERGRHNGVLCQRQLLGFLKDAARSANGPTQLVVSEMSAGGKALSWEIGLRLGDRHFAYVTSHVNALTDYSPARLHMEFSQRQALADNMAAFDLMVPNDAYKASWSTGSVETHDYHLPLTAMGWLYGRVYLELLRPVIRAAYYRLPPRVLRFLKRIIGH